MKTAGVTMGLLGFQTAGVTMGLVIVILELLVVELL